MPANLIAPNLDLNALRMPPPQGRISDELSTELIGTAVKVGIEAGVKHLLSPNDGAEQRAKAEAERAAKAAEEARRKAEDERKREEFEKSTHRFLHND